MPFIHTHKIQTHHHKKEMYLTQVHVIFKNKPFFLQNLSEFGQAKINQIGAFVEKSSSTQNALYSSNDCSKNTPPVNSPWATWRPKQNNGDCEIPEVTKAH